MNEPWFSESWAWLPGTLLGCLGGLWGMLVGTLAPQGKGKALVVGYYWFLLIVSILLLIAGLTALLLQQPYGVWYGLGLAGMLGTLVLGLNGRTMYAAYRRAEDRRMAAQNL